MGCIGSKRKFVIDDSKPGQGTTAMEVFTSIGLASKDIDLLFTAFWDIDADSSGSIRAIELFAYFNIELGVLEEHIFSVFDEDKSGVLNFMEFVCSMWNLLTLSDSNLGILAYLMKDPTGIFRIKFADIKEIMEIIHRRKIETSTNLMTIYNNLRKNYPAELSLQDFCKWTTENSAVLTPLLILQLKLRKQIINEHYWVRLATERSTNPEMGDSTFVNKLKASIKQKNDAYIRKMEDIERERLRRERLGLGANGDTRNNVARKESILLGVFNLKQKPGKTSGQNSSSKSILPALSTQPEDGNDDEDTRHLSHNSPSGRDKVKPGFNSSLSNSRNSSRKLNKRDNSGSILPSKHSGGNSKNSKQNSYNSSNPGKASNGGKNSNNNSSNVTDKPVIRSRRSFVKPKLTVKDDKLLSSGGSGGGGGGGGSSKKYRR